MSILRQYSFFKSKTEKRASETAGKGYEGGRRAGWGQGQSRVGFLMARYSSALHSCSGSVGKPQECSWRAEESSGSLQDGGAESVFAEDADVFFFLSLSFFFSSAFVLFLWAFHFPTTPHSADLYTVRPLQIVFPREDREPRRGDTEVRRRDKATGGPFLLLERRGAGGEWMLSATQTLIPTHNSPNQLNSPFKIKGLVNMVTTDIQLR